MEQLSLDVEKTPLRFLGGVHQNDDNFEIVYQYVRDVAIEEILMPDVSSDIKNDSLRNHFILFNSFNE